VFGNGVATMQSTITNLEPRVFKLFRDNSDYIIKLHGSIDDPSSMIFSKSDYNKYAYGSWVYTKFIDTLLLTYTIIFIGFSMTDPAISFLVEMYAERLPESRPHYIFLAGDIPETYIQITKRLRKLFVIPYSENDNHIELITLIKQLEKEVALHRRSIIAEDWKLVNES